MSTKMQLEWRRRQVFDLSSKGYNQTQIAKILQISESTISRDLELLRLQSKENIKKYVDELLPEEYEKCLVGLNAILREAWTTSYQTEDKREKIQALSLAKECYSMKLELLTNATVVDDAIRFVSDRSKDKENLKSSAAIYNDSEHDKEESDKPDHYENGNQLEENQKEEADETTKNQVF
jgi:predicted transcriptional regulator